MIFKSESLEPIKKQNKSNQNSIGINKNQNSGLLLVNKKKKIMSSCKNTENRMMLKSDNLIYKLKNLPFKLVENSKIQKDKSQLHKPVKLNSIKLLNNLKNNTIKDIFYLLSGKKLPRLLLKEIRILIEQAKILQVLWIKLTKIKKFWIKEKNNQMDKRNSIQKNKPKMFSVIETLVIEKIN